MEDNRGRKLKVYQKTTDQPNTPFNATIIKERPMYWLADYRDQTGQIRRTLFNKGACTLVPKRRNKCEPT